MGTVAAINSQTLAEFPPDCLERFGKSISKCIGVFYKSNNYEERKNSVKFAHLRLLKKPGNFNDYRFICNGGLKYWKEDPEIAKLGLEGMKNKIGRMKRQKRQRIIEEYENEMVKLNWL